MNYDDMALSMPTEVEWQARAACRGHDPDLWFPISGNPPHGDEARAICAECPVRVECGDEADSRNEEGIWGGVNRVKKYTTKPPQAHGTDYGYQQHYRSGEKACDPCREAHRVRRQVERRTKAVA